MKKCLGLIIFLSFFSVCFADTIYFKNGTKFEGTIVKEAEDEICLEMNVGSGVMKAVFKRDEIEKIERSSGKKSEIIPPTIKEKSVPQQTVPESHQKEKEAKTSNEHLGKAYNYFKRGEYDKAIFILEEAVSLYPAEANIHYGLVDSYNELGQKHYFSKELCLRIIYHTEKFLELKPVDFDKMNEIMEFLRKSIGHYDVASRGENVRIIEGSGDRAEFYLPPDNITIEEKLRYKDKAVQRLKDYDISKPSLYQTEISDKRLEEIAKALNEDAEKIASIHYKKVNNYMDKMDVLDEAFYKKPDKFKTIQHGQVFVFRDNTIYSIDPNTKKVYDTTEISQGDVQYFDELGKTNISYLSKYYELASNKIKECPNFLKILYGNTSFPNLYLVTAKIKKDRKESWPPISKLEYFVDLDYNLIIAQREYWKGVVSSGREEDLAKETIIKKVKKYEDNLYLPLEGTTRGFVEELAGVKEDWSIEIISLNKEIDDIEFSVSRYSK